MPRNVYFSQAVKSEQHLYEDLIIESLGIYGQDVYYIPRTLVNRDNVLNEDPASKFDDAYLLEMYIENTEGFEGSGDLYSKFGLEIRDDATFIVSRRRWDTRVGVFSDNLVDPRPQEGDLIFLPMTNSFFEITFVEDDQPFYQLSNLPVYKLRAQLFEYNDEDLDTGVDAIDNIEKQYAYTYLLKLDEASSIIVPGETATQTLSSGVTISGEITKWSDSDKLLHLVHIDTSDNKYHEFTTGTITITGDRRDADSDMTVSSITEDNRISSNEQNDDFSTLADGFLDFSEDTPFGDPENN